MPEKLSFVMPKGACNAHLHIIDPVFTNNGKAKEQIGTVEMYKKIAEQLHLERAVFVQAKPFGCDNACLVDAIKRFGPAQSVGIAVVHQTVSDAELKALHNKGVRGLRFSVWNPKNAVVSFEECLPLSARVKDMGWNMQLHMSAAQLFVWADIVRKLPTKIVIDHMGRLDPKLGLKDPAYKFILELIDQGHTWIKLSGTYLNTQTGYPWDDATVIAKALADYAPERVVWGSDYPHVTEKVKPSEAQLTEMIAQWLPTEKARNLALVKNPEELYGFNA